MPDLPDSLEPHVLLPLLKATSDAVFVTDEQGVVRYWNQGAERMLGYRAEEILGQGIERILPGVRLSAEGRELADETERLRESKAVYRDGSVIWVERSSTTAMVGGELLCLHIVRDVNLRVQRMVELEREVITDEVSSLLNRRGFQGKLESNLCQKLTLAIVDIDNFKDINDRFGHLAGDETIAFVAQLLRKYFSDAICVSRMGGDEFSVLMETGDASRTHQQFEEFRGELSGSRITHHGIEPKVSVGVVIANRANVTARELLTQADQSMYESKTAGRNQTTVSTIE